MKAREHSNERSGRVMSSGIRGEDHANPVLSCRTYARIITVMSDNVAAEIRARIECGHCARIDQRVLSVCIPSDLATPALEKVCAVCEYCGSHAVMYLERAVKRLH
jgi:hypothetical protein